MRLSFKKSLLAFVVGIGFASSSGYADSLSPTVVACNRAIQLLKPLAEGGDAAAQYALGHAYSAQLKYCGGLKRDWDLALPWYQKAAEQGHAGAQHEFANIHSIGWIVPKDEKKALEWYRKAAAQDHRASISLIAGYYRDGEIVEKDRVLHYMLKVLSTRDEEWSGSDYVPDMLAVIRRKMSPDQVSEAEQLIKDWKVGTPLPMATKTGRKPPVDWFVKEALTGDLEAQYRAGLLYKEGDLFLRMNEDDEKAVHWLRKAAERGHADAQFQLGVMNEQMRGMPPDAVIAFMLWSLSAKSGNEQARYKRDRLEKILTEEQRAEANALIADWKVGTPFPTQTRTGIRQKSATAKATTD